MSCSNKFWRFLLAGSIAYAVLLPLLDQRCVAQSPDERWQKAVSLFNSTAPGSVEDACDIMKQLVQEYPGSQDYETSQRTFCRQVKLMIESEKRVAEEGLQFARAGNCSGARSAYERILPLGTRDPRYRDQLKAELASCETKASATSADKSHINQARQLFQNGKDSEARALLQPVASGNGGLAQEAKQVLASIEHVEAKDRESIDEARKLAAQDKKAKARDLLRNVVRRGGPESADARQLLDHMGSATSDDVLRAALTEYFEGNLAKAEDDFTTYIGSNGDHQALACFFRGVTRASRYYLSGETDTQQKTNALTDFRAVKQKYKDFHPPTRYISPKILDLYSSR